MRFHRLLKTVIIQLPTNLDFDSNIVILLNQRIIIRLLIIKIISINLSMVRYGLLDCCW
jgi:hypothetical protein